MFFLLQSYFVIKVQYYYYYHSSREPTESIWRGEAKLGRRLTKLFIYQANYSILLHYVICCKSLFFITS